ncbi:leucoanthocyanidin dioxygenase [Apiospora phragmitis]|uniref:Leucoanthocyanidin dioxygenase n=1 Tax=Apiospora phragmitis TaxID=2905665 RepID=A0ABR1WSN3_9PEZI
MANSTKYVDREIPQISLANFDERIDEVTSQLCDAAENTGFFAIVDHGLAPADVAAMFVLSERFFRLPDAVKATVPWNLGNVGWERESQVRPSTGAPDRKESYQLQFGENMVGHEGASLWLRDEHLPGFRDRCLVFMHRVQRVSERLMVCLARGLGFEGDDYFIKYHDASKPTCQSVMRLLHYFETPHRDDDGQVHHRAGAHADWGFLTLLFEKKGQSGLEICPGREMVSEHNALEDAAWSKVHFVPGSIVCNIGDLLMSWSDDRFKSTFHRVKAPCGEPGDYYGERFSIAFFNQPCKDALIQGPLKKYPLVTGEQFNAKAMSTQFAALQAKAAAEREDMLKSTSSNTAVSVKV